MTTSTSIRSDLRRTLKDEKSLQVDACETGWVAASNVTVTQDATVYKEGTYSTKMVVAAGHTTGLVAYKDLTEVDISQYAKIVFWVRSTIATYVAGDLHISLCLGNGGAGALEALDVPAISVADAWCRFAISFTDPALYANVVGVALYVVTDRGASTIYLDDICVEPSSYNWTNDDLDRHIEQAVEEFSESMPRRLESILLSQVEVHLVDWIDETHEITSSDASTLATAYTLLNEIKTDYALHIASTVFHSAADATNTIAAADATTRGTAITLANELKTDINAHFILSGCHPHDDEVNHIVASTAYDTGNNTNTDTLICDLANDIKAKYNSHLDARTDGRDLDITAVTGATGYIRVEQAEYPLGEWPRQYTGFEVHGNKLTMNCAQPPTYSDEHIGVYYHVEHTLSASASTIPTEYEDLVKEGAAAYALLQLAADRTDRINIGDPSMFYRLGNDKLALFRNELRKLRLKNKKPSNIVQSAVWR